jgi:hypothetical protein
MAKEATLTKHGSVELLSSLGKYFLSALRGSALVAGGIGGLVIVGFWILLLVFPIFLLVSFMMKFLGF